MVRISATSINLSDWECLTGSPLYARIGGLRSPARRTLGSDIAGWAKQLGANVTGVDNGDKLAFMRSLGVDEVIDYRRDDFARDRESFDLILDLVAQRSVFVYRRALAAGGRYRCVGGSVPTLLRVLTAGTIVGRLSGRWRAFVGEGKALGKVVIEVG